MAPSELPKFPNSFRAENPVTRESGDRGQEHLQRYTGLWCFWKHSSQSLVSTSKKAKRGDFLGSSSSKTGLTKAKQSKLITQVLSRISGRGEAAEHNSTPTLADTYLWMRWSLHVTWCKCLHTWLLWSYHMSVGKWALFCVTWTGNHCTEPAPAKATILIPQRWSLQAPTLAGHWWWRDTTLQLSTVYVQRGKYILWGCLSM